MKVHVTIFAVVIVSALLIAGCSNNGANPTGYVNGYTVHLTDSAGTTYTGDFFPFTKVTPVIIRGTKTSNIRQL